MSSAHQSLSAKKMVNIDDVDHFRFTIITAQWNHEVTLALEQGCIETLIANGISQDKIEVIPVPGSWELISAARQVLSHKNSSAVICIGAVIRGGTPHFEYICQGVTNGLAQLCASQDTPVIYGILTLNTMQEAIDRSGGQFGNKGDEAAITALEMANAHRAILKNKTI
jgi:6,7-dimethyl-8-ribityllumazine synthase